MVTLTVLVAGMLLTTVALANDVDDVADVKAAVLQHTANTNTGNVDGFVNQHLPGHSAFGPTGTPRGRSYSIEEERKRVQAAFDAARQRDPSRTSVRAFSKVEVKDLEVRVYGIAAIATAYLAGINTFPDGRTEPLTLRLTSVWVKQDDGQWKEAHDHLSELRGAIPGE
ncbi:MAG: nuclear transport factor 2 family protein [Acidobacteria bacterium]|nr:nuclear transport factor 2 family protein [Acidobacteriota bacterium]